MPCRHVLREQIGHGHMGVQTNEWEVLVEAGAACRIIELTEDTEASHLQNSTSALPLLLEL